jgi:hypothetical protein
MALEIHSMRAIFPKNKLPYYFLLWRPRFFFELFAVGSQVRVLR